MKDKLFFDTNILVYAFDSSEPAKRDICQNLIDRVTHGEIIGVVSNQVLAELFDVSIRKMGVPIKKAMIMVQTIALSDKWQKINYTQDTVSKVADKFDSLRVPFWDLLIAETMKENDIIEIITENERDFNGIPGIKVRNPI